MINLPEHKQTGVPSVQCFLARVQRQRFRFDVSRDTPARPSLIRSTKVKSDMEHWCTIWKGDNRSTVMRQLKDGDTL
jgi:hypothetical protein